MSEVRMSLQEYNEMKEKMDRQNRILNAILNPAPISSWDIQYYKEHPSYSMPSHSLPLENLSAEDKDYLKSLIYRGASVRAEEQFVQDNMAVVFEMNPIFQLGYFKGIEETKEEEA